MYPNILVEKRYNIFSHESSWLIDSQFESTQRILDKIGVSYSVVFYMKEYKKDDEISKQKCEDRKKSAFCYLSSLQRNDNQTQQCLKEIYIDYKNETEGNASIAFVKEHENLRNIYVYGSFMTYINLDLDYPQFEDYYNPG